MTGFEFIPISGSFKGMLDGQGHTIYNFKMSVTVSESGMFKLINKAIFKNIIFKDVNIDSSYSGIGVIAGTTEYNTSYFYNIGITGKIAGRDNLELFTTQTSSIYSGTGIQADEFKDSNNFENWDFVNDWYIDENGFPELRF